MYLHRTDQALLGTRGSCLWSRTGLIHVWDQGTCQEVADLVQIAEQPELTSLPCGRLLLLVLVLYANLEVKSLQLFSRALGALVLLTIYDDVAAPSSSLYAHQNGQRARSKISAPLSGQVRHI